MVVINDEQWKELIDTQKAVIEKLDKIIELVKTFRNYIAKKALFEGK